MGLKLKKPDDAVGSATPAILIGCFVAFGGVLFGYNSLSELRPITDRNTNFFDSYDTGTIGGILAMKEWRDLFSTGFTNPKDNQPDVTANQSSLIVSILSAGTFCGALAAAPTADTFGRRLSMILESLMFTFGVVLQTAATSIPLFVAGRFFAGFGVGLLSATIPLYQSETSPKWIRGTIVGCYQFAITIGLLLAAVVNNATKDLKDTGSYRIPIAVQFAWALILITGMLILPETPRYLIKSDKFDEAAKSLARLRRLDVNHPSLVQELAEIQANHEYELSLGKATYYEIFRGPLQKRLATGCSLQGLQQLTGVNFICMSARLLPIPIELLS
jgi:MFS transporter, SP family, sugar:H+ symporter